MKLDTDNAVFQPPSRVITRLMYLRFVYEKRVGGLQSREGFFQAAAELTDNPLTDPSTVSQVFNIQRWFLANLDTPERVSRSRSKGYYRRETKGLSWFKTSATEHLSKAFELKSILDECGYSIEVVKESRIGYVVYEDTHQVVAEPFAETAK